MATITAGDFRNGKLFEMDGVRFTVEEDALRAIAAKTVERKTGAPIGYALK